MNPISLIAISFVSGTIATSVLIVAALTPALNLLDPTLDRISKALTRIIG